MDEDSINSMESSAESETEVQDTKQSKTVSGDNKHKPGIIYLSKVPTGFNVSQTTSFFSEFGRYGKFIRLSAKKVRSHIDHTIIRFGNQYQPTSVITLGVDPVSNLPSPSNSVFPRS